MMNRKLLWSLVPAAAFYGCTHQIETKNDINLKPIEIKPIHITLDVNVKVDKALDSSFGEVDKAPAGQPGALTPVMADGAKPGTEARPPNPVRDAALARIKERLPKIDAFKAAGVLGEGNGGFLGLIKDHPEAKALAEAENGDRWTIYQEISKARNTTPDLVAKRRALKNLERAPAGTWVQDPDGKWRQKN